MSLRQRLHRIEDLVLAAMGIGLLLLAGLQVCLRALGGGVEWFDPLLRTMTLWLAMLGALVATREGRHLHIDLLARRLAERFGAWPGRLVLLFSTAVCAVLAQASYELVKLEYEGGAAAFAAVPNWLAMAILPIAFAWMALRFALQMIWPATAEPHA